MPEAGWYDDPQGGGGRRWWDGQRWSEHTTPPPGSMPATPAAPPAPVPTPAAPPAPGPMPAAPPTDTWQQQPTTGAGTWQPTAATPGGPSPAKKGGGGKIIAIILALVALVGIGVVVAVLLSGSDDVDLVGIDVRQSDGEIARVPEGGTWEMEVTVPSGLVVIDVRGLDGFDPVLEVYDASGALLGRNDDRSSSQLDRYGGDFLDSLLELELDAGTYRVVVEGFGGRGGDATVEFPVLGG